jgi:hypothetical protein
MVGASFIPPLRKIACVEQAAPSHGKEVAVHKERERSIDPEEIAKESMNCI